MGGPAPKLQLLEHIKQYVIFSCYRHTDLEYWKKNSLFSEFFFRQFQGSLTTCNNIWHILCTFNSSIVFISKWEHACLTSINKTWLRVVGINKLCFKFHPPTCYSSAGDTGWYKQWNEPNVRLKCKYFKVWSCSLWIFLTTLESVYTSDEFCIYNKYKEIKYWMTYMNDDRIKNECKNVYINECLGKLVYFKIAFHILMKLKFKIEKKINYFWFTNSNKGETTYTSQIQNISHLAKIFFWCRDCRYKEKKKILKILNMCWILDPIPVAFI